MHRNRSVSTHQFAMVPRADIPRSAFNRQYSHKTTFDAGFLIPVYVDECLPGDSFNVKMTAFARLATPIVPFMDNLHLDSFFFFVPNRLVWDNWVKFMGEQVDPDDSTDFLVPQVVSPVGGFAPLSIFDYLGLPTSGQVLSDKTASVCSLPLRAYNLIWNQWFRSENLQDSVKVSRGDAADPYTDFTLLRRGKRHDYFTSALPWPQKGESVSLPLGLSAPVKMTGTPSDWASTNAGVFIGSTPYGLASTNSSVTPGVVYPHFTDASVSPLFADLSDATAATINQLRQAFQIQRLLERDARGGTRYTELIRSHFGVDSPDSRLQRPEYLGGGSTFVTVNPIAQTSGSPGSGGYTSTPQGNLAAMGTALAQGHGFNYSCVEHGFIIGMLAVRADLTYQQGLRKMWSRRTRYDFYFPVFSHLGEQVIYNKEIYFTGDSVEDNKAFGYQERWAEYRYFPSQISGLFKSTTPLAIDQWHLAQRFLTTPTLSPEFIEDRPPVERITAVGAEADGQQFLCDMFFNIRTTRAMPLYSVPGLIDHF